MLTVVLALIVGADAAVAESTEKGAAGPPSAHHQATSCLPQTPPFLPGGMRARRDSVRTDPENGVYAWSNGGMTIEQRRSSVGVLKQHPELRGSKQLVWHDRMWAAVIPVGDFPPAPITIHLRLREGCVVKDTIYNGPNLKHTIRYARNLLMAADRC